MSTFTFSHGLPTYDWQQLMAQALGAGTVANASGTGFTLVLADDGGGREVKIVFTGTGFTYGVNSLLTSGSFSGGSLIVDDVTVVTLSGYGAGNEPSFEDYNNALDVIRAPGSTPQDMDIAVAQWVQTEAATVIGSGDGEFMPNSAYNDTLIGNGGDDTMFGGPGADTIDGGAGDDEIWGNEGQDFLRPGSANDTVHGGDGWDELSFDGGGLTDYVFITVDGVGSGYLVGVVDGLAVDTTFDGIEALRGTATDDSFTVTATGRGTAFSSSLNGAYFAIDMTGGHGSDHFIDQSGVGVILMRYDIEQLIDNTGGGVSINISGHSITLHYENGDPDITLLTGQGLDPYGEVDTFEGVRGFILTNQNDLFVGGDDGYLVDGKAGNDLIQSGNAGDLLEGGEGDDTIEAGGGNDEISGGAGNDSLVGGAGNDSFTGGSGDDMIDGGGDRDYISYQNESELSPPGTYGVIVNLSDGPVTGTATGHGTVEVAAHRALDSYGDTDELIGIERVRGTTQDDWLVGGYNDDWLRGDRGSDVVIGGGGNDYFVGGSGGSDTVDGGAGHDMLAFEGIGGGDHVVVTVDGAGSGTVTGQDGLNPVNTGFSGIEAIRGSIGEDTFTIASTGRGTEYSDDFHLNDGDDETDNRHLAIQLTGGAGDDTFIDNSTVTGGVAIVDYREEASQHSGDATGVVVNNSVNSLLLHENQADPDEVTDTIAGGTARDTYGDTDTLAGVHAFKLTDMADQFVGGDGGNWVQGRGGNDVIEGGSGRDNLNGGLGNDTLYGGGGEDDLQGGDGDDEVNGGDGDDYLRGGQGEDTIDGGADRDTVTYRDDRLENDTPATHGVIVNLSASSINASIDGDVTTHSVDSLFALDSFGSLDELHNIEDVDASEFDDYVVGNAGENQLRGNGGHDTLIGGSGEDQLQGGDGNDSMVGGGVGDHESDFFVGGRGNDTMVGGEYGGENNRVQYEGETDWGNDDSGEHGVIVNLSGQVGSAYADAAAIVIGGHTLGELGAFEAFDSYGDTDSLINIQNASGTQYADVIIGGPENSDFDGRDGNDYLFGGSGNNQFQGGAGNDTIIGGDGDDFAEGGRGDNYMDGGESDHEYDNVQYLEQTAGIVVTKTDSKSGTVYKLEDSSTDTFINFEIVVGSNHADVFNGSAENDDFTGNGGADTFNGGDGSDFVQYEKEHNAPGGETTHGVIVNLSSQSLDNVFLEPGDDGVNVAAHTAIDAFGDTDELNSIERIRGTNHRDIIIGSDTGRSELNGEGGNDFLQLTGAYDPGQDGNSGSLEGGDGDDTLVGDNYNNDLGGGTGNDFIDARGGQFDYINGSSGADTIDGGDGYDMIGFKGENSADHIHVILNTGGLDEFGDPMMETGSGTISGVFHDGWDDLLNQPLALSVNSSFVNLERVVGTSGADTFVNGGYNPTASAEWVFGDRSETPFTAFSFVGGAGNDIFTDTTGTNTATVIDYDEEKYSHGNYDGHTWGSGDGELGVAINFSGGDIVADGDTIASGTARDTFGDTDTITGVRAFRLTDANDTFHAGNGADFEADGRQGDDLLVGADGNDLLIGDAGNDTLQGGAGNDTLWLGQGNDSATGGAGADTFGVAPGIDTVTDFNASEDKIDLGAFLDVQSFSEFLEHVDQLNTTDLVLNFGPGNVTTFAGVNWNDIGVEDVLFGELPVYDGSPNDDDFVGDDRPEIINGNDGNDVLNGLGGDDTINGGNDNDTLIGGQGNDVLDGGDGKDRVGYAAEEGQGGTRGVIVNLSGDLLEDISAEGQDTQDVQGHTAVDTFGTIDTISNVEDAVGTQFGDYLRGDDGRNSLQGRAGDDTIFGGGGNDFIRGDRGSDEIHGGDDFDRLSYEGNQIGDGVVVSFGAGAGNGTVVGNAGGGAVNSTFDGIEAVRTWDGADTFTTLAGTVGTEFSDRFYIDDGIDGTDDEHRSIVVTGGQGGDTFTDNTPNGVLFVDYREEQDMHNVTVGVIVNLSGAPFGDEGEIASGTARDTYGDIDTIVDVRAFQLTDFADTFQALGSDVSFHVRAGGGNDYIQGGNGNDTLNGDDGDDTIYGGAGKEDIQGGQGDDLIYSGDGDHGANDNQGGSLSGGRGNDTIHGGDGNEYISISWGDDTVDGGGGGDMLAIRRANPDDVNEPEHTGDHIDVIFDGLGAGTITGEYGEEAMSVAFSNIERVRGSVGNDSFTATVDAQPTENGQDFHLPDGNDETDDRHYGIGVTGGDGADSFVDNSGVHGGVLVVDYQEEKHTHDDYNGGPYGTTPTQLGVVVNMSATEQLGVVSGTARDTFGNTDTISGVHAFRLSDTDDTFFAGNDGYAVQAGDGDDTLIGGTGGDNLGGDEGDDSVVGGDGNDWVGGWRGNDTLDGGNGRDSLEGEGGTDSMTGGTGDDWFRGGAGADFMDGGSENDKVQYREERDDNGDYGTEGVIVNLTDDDVTVNLGDGNGAQLVAGHRAKDSFGDIDTIISISNVEGTDFADYIKGDGGFNELVGNGGNDTLIGGEGEGQFDGGDGNDLMTGGSSDDFFRAGTGNDTIDGGGNGEGEYDNLEYFDAQNGITVDKLSRGAGTVTGAWAGVDEFTNIEIVVGTAYADTFNGSEEDDDFTGFKGDDTFNGGDGVDRVVYDKESHGPNNEDAHGVIVNLSNSALAGVSAEGIPAMPVAAHTAIDSYGGTDALNSIEAIAGSEFNDYLKGSDTAFSDLQGRDGDDTIVAGAFDGEGNNASYLEGGRGADSLVGGDYNDQLNAGNGDDTVLAGDGDDYIRGSAGGADSVDGGNGYDMIGFGGIAGDGDGNGITVTFSQSGVAGGGTITGEIHDNNQNEGSVLTTFADIERIEGSNADDTFELLGDGFVNGSNSGAVFVDYLGEVRGEQGAFDLSGGGGDDSFTDLSTAEGGVLLISYDGERWSHQDYDGHQWGNEAGEHGVLVNFSASQQTAIDFNLNDGNGPSDHVIAANSGLDTYGNTDSYSGIRMTWLTAADDWLWTSDAGTFAYGERGSDHLFGGSGNDMLVGGEGDDTLSAGGGQDTLTYAMNSGASPDGVIVNLSDTGQTIGGHFVDSGEARDNWGNTDTVSGFEIVVGTTHDDVVLGATSEGTILIGGSGNDRLVGGNAGDALRGDQGNDSLEGGGGIDTVDYHREQLSNTSDWPFPGEDNAPRAGVIVNLSAGQLIVGLDTIGAGTARDSFGTTDTFLDIENVDGSEFGDLVLGSTGNNQIRGFEGNDTLDGGGGNDTIYGGTGNDTIVFESGTLTVADFVAGGTDDRIDLTAFGSINSLSELLATLSDAGNHTDAVFSLGGQTLTLTGVNYSSLTGADFLFSEATNVGPEITSNEGGATADVNVAENTSTVTTVVASDSDGPDAVTYRIAGGADAALFSIDETTGVLSFIAAPDFETPADAGGDNIYNVIVEAWDGSDADSQALAVTVTDGDGVTITGTGGGDTVNASQTVSGQPGPTNDNDTIDGLGGNDSLSGLAGNDTIDGGAGVDTLIGGIGDDTYQVDDAGDVVTELTGQGTDTVSSTAASYVLGANVETLILEVGAVSGTGNGLDNRIEGNAAANALDGGAGADVLVGMAGDDSYYVDSSSDAAIENDAEGTDKVYSTAAIYTLGANVENLELLGGANLQGIGNTLDNYLTGSTGRNFLGGGIGSDTLDGGLGIDTLSGGAGNDTYFVDNSADVVTEAASDGNDTVHSTAANYTLGLNVETLVLNGGAVSGTGNTLANRIEGNAADNTLDGGAGADTLVGGLGNDTYYVDSTIDVITENSSEGTDKVYSSAAIHTLGANVENLELLGSANLQGIGNALDNYLMGNAGKNYLGGGIGADTLDGGAGIDTLSGGTGNDTFYVDNSADSVVEAAGEGSDTVHSTAASYTLGANVEILLLDGGAIGGTGNSLANHIEGNAAANTLDGGGGADTLVGGLGDDTYYVDNAGDVTTENDGEGTDKVYSTAAIYTLGTNVENLELLGNGNLQGIGNSSDNYLTGNSGQNFLGGGIGSDTLDGGLGIDTLSGGAGNDTYHVDDTADVVTEAVGDGSDTVHSTAASYTLGANVETLVLDDGATSGTGNGGANRIEGNAEANTLDGGAGADTLAGMAGDDTYYVDNSNDAVIEAEDEGTDKVYSTATVYTLDANVENLELLGSANLQGIGNGSDNYLTGNAGRNWLGGGIGNDTLDGGAAIDTMSGGVGDDTFYVEDAGDVVTEFSDEGNDTVYSTASSFTLSANIETLVLDGSATSGTGNSLANRIEGNAVANTLDGGGGADTLVGGLGDDTYYVDSTSDVVTENGSEGTDKVYSTAAIYTLGVNVENLELLGSANLQGTGNASDNSIIGNAGRNWLGGGIGSDTLDGGLGIDTLSGGAGNDTYYVNDSGDLVTEVAGEGTDTVNSTAASYALSVNVENLVLLSGATSGTGNSLGNRIEGNASANTLDGGAGADTLVGGLGDDTYFVDSTSDVVTENGSEGTDKVYSTAAIYTLGINVENLELLGSANLQGIGNASDNSIIGNGGRNWLGGGIGSDTLNGGAGIDTLSGGAGNDTFLVDDAADAVTELNGEGTDTVYSTAASYTLGANVENLVLQGGATTGTGNTLANRIDGNAAANTLDGGAGADTLAGGLGDDTYYVDGSGDVITENDGEGIDKVYSTATVYTLGANVENLELLGNANLQGIGNGSDNSIIGNAGRNWLGGGIGSDTLDGGLGIDTLSGGAGDDTYVVDEAADMLTEVAGEGTDTVYSTALSYTLGVNVENLTLLDGATNGTGNTLANRIEGNADANTLDGSSGIDTLVGMVGDDTYYVDSTSDVVIENDSEGNDKVYSTAAIYTLGANVENLELLGGANLQGIGNALDNYLTGNAGRNWLGGGIGSDTLDGGLGIDTLSGGGGNDSYVVDDSADVVTEAAGEGEDTVHSSATGYTLSTNVENLVLEAGATNGTGNTLGNRIEGNASANTLDGGAGADTLLGGLGDDIYYVDSGSDVITENSDEGTDKVYSTAAVFTLGANVENLELLGSANLQGIGNGSNNNLVGNAGRNFLGGGIGADTLDGGAGIDTLSGGAGNDTFYIDNTADMVTELAGEGTDTVYSTAASYALGTNVENLVLQGSAAINGSGNSLANRIEGNSAINTLNGGAGVDTLVGGDGNDIYHVDSGSDVIIENGGEGIDKVYSTAGIYTLSANVENLELLGSSNLQGIGNGSDNNLTGNAGRNWLGGGIGNDTLDGGAGIDTMSGGVGDDTFYVDDAADSVTELVGGGNDTVYSTAANYTLAANVESLLLAGADNLNGTGNGLNNILVGNVGQNTLYGGDGSDTLTGGVGQDTFVFNLAPSISNTDTITDFSAGDKLGLYESVFGSGLVEDNFAFGAAAGDADDRLIYDSATGVLLYDADGNGGGAAVQVATLSNHYSLTWSDLEFL